MGNERSSQQHLLKANSRILIGVCSAQIHGERRRAIRATWFRQMRPGVRAFFFVGGNTPAEEDDVIVIPTPDSYEDLPEKVHRFYKFALEHFAFDFLFKCDDDTYVVADRLLGLAADGVHFLGSKEIGKCGFASGGAGYLMSREMVGILASGPTPGKGPEDVIFTDRARASGFPLLETHALQGFDWIFPTASNDLATGHSFGPAEMHELHTRFAGETWCLLLHASHRAWAGTISLFGDGTFRGGAESPDGYWEAVEGGATLLLKWHSWPADRLSLGNTGFCGQHLTLRFEGQSGMERWFQLVALVCEARGITNST